MNLKIVNGDLLDQDVEVIVNAWNRNIIPWWLLLPQGVSGAIKRRAGYGPFWELGRKGPIPLGGAVQTGAGRLPFKAIIHVAGISMFWRSSERSIYNSVQNAIRLVAMMSTSIPARHSSALGLPQKSLERLNRLHPTCRSPVGELGHVHPPLSRL